MILFIPGLFPFTWKEVQDRTIWGTFLLLGGALGNLTDRLFRGPSFAMGHVVDFIQLPNFAIFNIADSAISVGAGCLVIDAFRESGKRPKGEVERRQHPR